ncbi:MAG: MBL fold metallo-hydrolase [Clostridia bacterium]|nr:MBL fold metallo-hydrolase [Clostridia bacterium]
MRLHLLGVNGPFPASGGATSGFLLEAGDLVLQLDFGSGVLSRLTEKFPPEDLDALLISHWHFDHTCDLLPLIYRLESCGKKLPVYGPADESSGIRRMIAQAACLDLHEVAPGDSLDLGETRILVGPARHPVPGVGFRVEAEGRSLGYTGDTNTLPSLADFYRGCDLLLADGLFPEDAWAESKPHLSASLAASLAREAGVGQLILTHLNPFFSPDLLLREARGSFPGVRLARAGDMVSL